MGDALIVATSQYEDSGFGPLSAPLRDAEELARVLEDPAIGGFRVRILADQPGHLLRMEIETFFAGRRQEDLLVLYMSCHGLKDADGQLHFVASTTKPTLLASTGISADFVYEQVRKCRARRVLLLLDCCYSGAFSKGHRHRAESRATIRPLEGRGRAIITSCTALQYSFEIGSGQVPGTAEPAIFTSAVVEGLRTGAADRDGDGRVSADELYAYAYERVRESTPHQTPEKIWEDVQGDFIIARNPKAPIHEAGTVPPSSESEHEARRAIWTRRAVISVAVASAGGLTAAGWNLSRPRSPGHPRVTSTPRQASAPRPLWSAQLPAGTGLNAVVGNIVYAGAGVQGNFYALRGSDGSVVWKSNLSFQSVSTRGETVYASDNARFYALNAATGHVIWHAGVAPSVVPAVHGRYVYVADQYGTVQALRAGDGVKAWEFTTAQGEPSGVTALGDTVFTAGGNNGAAVFAIRSGREAWRFPASNTFAGPAVDDKSVYVADNTGLFALVPSTGSLRWKTTAFVTALPFVTSEGLLVCAQYGLFMLRPGDGSKIWGLRIDNPYLPCVASGMVYIRDGLGGVAALNIASGRKVWSRSFEALVAAIGISNGILYVGSNNLYALRASDGVKIWELPIEIPQGGNYMIVTDSVYCASQTGEFLALKT